ncbi:V-type ATP synthase subunit D [Wukongibacter sp. M2B1]|uniref:V-type ATP synthase subunit D n=1 Tax=Wukongibacter sp. M2B1 TaxID=3088895 RepID=UPI003D7B0C1B
MLNTTPTKANLIKAKNLLTFSQKGYELLDKKRSVLVREMMGLIDRVKDVQSRIDTIFEDAYRALQVVNVTMGLNNVEEVAISIPKLEDYDILLRSIMGVEIPTVKYEEKVLQPYYGFFRTNPALDIAVTRFKEVKYLIYELAEIENSIYKLAMEIKKTQKRANGLEKIQIPKYKKQVKFISEALEEKEREDFFRLKKVKTKKL